MDGLPIALAVFGLFFAGIIKGTTGLGYTSCALPFLVPVIGLKPSIGLLIAPAIMSNLQVVVTAGHVKETLTRFAPLYFAMLPGIAVGLAVLTSIDQALATRILGVVIIGYALLSLTRPQFTIGPRAEALLRVPVGFLNGVLTGLTGSQVMPLFPYMMSLKLDPNRLVQAINLAVTIASSALAVGLIVAGVATAETALYSAMAVVPAMIGVALGTQVRQLIPVAQFRKIVLVVLLAIGGMLLT